MRTTHATDRGFTVLELMIVVLVISLLMAVAIPSFFGARARSQDRISQVNLTTGVKAEIAFSSGGDGFTAVSATLAAAEPSLDWSGMADESLHVVVGDVVVGDNWQVLIYSKSATGTWLGIRIVAAGVNGDRYTCAGSTEANVDDLSDCTGSDW